MTRIPKKIHYCWVGGNEKPQSVKYCINSWKKYCPDYEIIEWNETNYDFSKNNYMKQAYDAKKWGFVPDYARLDIIYEHGGIYFDTDVELVASLDSLLDYGCFMGFENTGDGSWYVNCGHGFGSVAHNEIIKAARDLYDSLSFLNDDGLPNLQASPFYTTKSLMEFGLKQENKDQQLDGVMVFASDVLCPKCFRTGKITRTARTVSIHHFSASWVDEKIKKEMKHQQTVKNILGQTGGKYYLYAESVLQKYSGSGLVKELPSKAFNKTKKELIKIKDNIPYYSYIFKSYFSKRAGSGIVLLDTSLNSDNSGDSIIMESCEKQLSDCLDISQLAHVPTHSLPGEEDVQVLKTNKLKILCGTNILSGHMRNYRLWKTDNNISMYKDTVLLAVGFDSNDMSFDFYSKQFFNSILSKEYYHSVRDTFSEQKLKSMGIQNVLYTGCATMWGLTPELCRTVPVDKGKYVLTTITDYAKDPANDSCMINILLHNYEKVYLWLQGKNDYKYVCDLGFKDAVYTIPSDLASLDGILSLEKLDYVGTRLHAGIRAVSKGKRSLIISIDNRAECIGKDTNLPVLKRESVPVLLNELLNKKYTTEINMPWDNINKWKSQFKNGENK